ncbi:MAG TPA: hypothetical protein VGD22_06960 [Sphingobacteriaceae bacterium]
MKILKDIGIIEKLILLFVFILLLIGVIASWTNLYWFNNVYVIEDGFIEWLTVLPLLVIVVVAIRYLVKLSSKRNWLFSVTMAFLAILCFFVAGEEISWGQRIFQVESSSFFKQNNAQAETNLHNLVVGGVKINKLIFSQALIAVAVIYLTLFPYLYKTKSWFKNLVTRAGIPIVRPYHIVALVVTAILIALCNGRNSELLEFAGCFIFLLIVVFPQNRETFT